jgi:type VI secretion system secreted protein Hcp
MFLKLDGIKGEAIDQIHEDEIEVLSLSWGIQGVTDVATRMPAGKARISELKIVKRVDASSPALMQSVHNNASIDRGVLTVRKSGELSLEYLVIEMRLVRVTSVTMQSQDAEIVESVNLSFAKVDVTYTPQQSGGAGAGKRSFHADVYAADR